MSASDPPLSNTRTEPEPEVQCWFLPIVDVAVGSIRSWRTSLFVVITGAISAAVYLQMTPPYYRAFAVATLLNREKPSVDVSVQTEVLESRDGGARTSQSASLVLPAQPLVYVELLASVDVMQTLAQRFEQQLGSDLSARERADVIRDLIEVKGTEEGLLTVEVGAEDAAFAAELANAILEVGITTSRSIEKRLMEQQVRYLTEATNRHARKLADAEAQLHTFQSTRELVDPGMEAADAMRQIRETTMLRDRLVMDREKRRLSFRDDEAGTRELTAQILAAENRVEDILKQVAGGSTRSEFGGLLGEFERLRQRVVFERDMLQTLRTQRDLYELRASEPSGNLVVVHEARPPIQPSGPSGRRVAMVSAAITVLVLIGLVLIREQWRRLRATDVGAARSREIGVFLSRLTRRRKGTVA